jgi:uncharacterized membrane protein
VTFWQVTADLLFATGVPAYHGHKYTSEYVDGWNTVLQLTAVSSGNWPASGRSSRPTTDHPE